ncbi:zinc finger protein [Daphnia sinensis]|uniref:Zinc finger protein n=1 Tax=Daphnia sinensis TaxID=1820382 RepID=A0AAD5KSF2_9CRUS|nr:zinc finger protein [Daphnia sinensis]
MDHSSTAIEQNEKIVLEPVSPSSSSSSSSPVPAIKLKRKCSSGWTLSNSGTNSVSKLRRGGRVKLKLRSWMAEPLVVKEGDASLRLATDLPRFNWLELKLNQKQDGTTEETKVCSSANNDDLPIVPLKIRILEKSSYAARLTEGLSVAPPAKNELDQSVAQHLKSDEASVPTCTSRWPLKKRLIRQLSPVTSPRTSPVASPITSPVASPVVSKVINQLDVIKPILTQKLCNATQITQERLQTELRQSPPAQRGPVIMRNILPPTPPASSAPPELMPVDADDQEKPLDLSRRCAFEAAPTRLEDKAEIEIIAMTTRINSKSVRQPVDFQPSRQRFSRNPAEIHRIQRNEKELVAKPVREHTIQRIPPIRAPESSFPDWNRNGTSGFRPYREQRPPVASTLVNTITPTSRPFFLPPLRPLPHHWKSLVVQQQRNPVVRPEVQLHPVGPTAPSTGFVTGPRLFHPQQVTAATTKKPLSIASHTMTTLPPDWSLRSCVVCSRRADFRCAGCHGNAYCSTLCQARDWPNHSQLCQRNS